jgi:uncharacterized protein
MLEGNKYMNASLPASSLVKKFPVIIYCLLVFSLTWGIKLLYARYKVRYGMPAFNFGLIASYGPSIAALMLIAFTEGKNGIHRTLKKLVDHRAGTGWILLASLFEPVLFLVITFACRIFYGEFPSSYDGISGSEILTLFTTFLFGIFFWGLSEEIGWRGWMLPKLQGRWSPLMASLVLAVVASFWHLNPVSFHSSFVPQEGEYIYGYFPAIVERIIISIPFTLVITYIFNRTRGSLLLMMLFHSGSNTGYFWIDGIFGVVKEDFFRLAFTVALALIMVVFTILLIKQRNKVTS